MHKWWRSHVRASAGGQPAVSHVRLTHFHCICVRLVSEAHHRWTGSLAAPYHLSKISKTQQEKKLQTSRDFPLMFGVLGHVRSKKIIDLHPLVNVLITWRGRMVELE